jgi:hypothetical protein
MNPRFVRNLFNLRGRLVQPEANRLSGELLWSEDLHNDPIYFRSGLRPLQACGR